MSCMFQSVACFVLFEPECRRCWRSIGLSAAAAAGEDGHDHISPLYSVTFDMNRKELLIVAALQQLLSSTIDPSLRLSGLTRRGDIC